MPHFNSKSLSTVAISPAIVSGGLFAPHRLIGEGGGGGRGVTVTCGDCCDDDDDDDDDDDGGGGGGGVFSRSGEIGVGGGVFSRSGEIGGTGGDVTVTGFSGSGEIEKTSDARVMSEVSGDDGWACAGLSVIG